MNQKLKLLEAKKRAGSPYKNRRSNFSVWNAAPLTSAKPALGKKSGLKKNETCDVCVIGAGIAGLTIAYFLAREGKSVIVLEKTGIGQGETLNTSAHLSNVIDAGYREIERYHGERGARLAAESHTAAIRAIETIVRDENIDCDFERVDGFLFLGSKDSPQVLEDELKAACRAGLEATMEPGGAFGLAKRPHLRFPGQAQFHAGKYMNGLARAVIDAGGTIYSGTEVSEVSGTETAEIKTVDGKTVLARFVVVASNTPFNDRVAMHTKQAAYRTYVIGVAVPEGTIPKGLYWDTEDPFHYVRVVKIVAGAKTKDVLIIGGEDHKTGQTEELENRYTRLLSWGRTHFGALGEPEFRWSGQIMDSADGLAFIGKNPGSEPNVFIVTGDSGVGLTHGTIAGILITDLIMGRENPWETLYDPSRKMIRAAFEFARENMNTAAQYSDWVTPGDVSEVKNIQPSSGAVVRDGLSKAAVYRDADGALHRCSAVCPHLGCIVAWNATESSWDCPCHGSRFDPLGKVLNGPSITALEAIRK